MAGRRDGGQREITPAYHSYSVPLMVSVTTTNQPQRLERRDYLDHVIRDSIRRIFQRIRLVRSLASPRNSAGGMGGIPRMPM